MSQTSVDTPTLHCTVPETEPLPRGRTSALRAKKDEMMRTSKPSSRIDGGIRTCELRTRLRTDEKLRTRMEPGTSEPEMSEQQQQTEEEQVLTKVL